MEAIMSFVQETLAFDSIFEMKRYVVGELKKMFACDAVAFFSSTSSMKKLDVKKCVHIDIDDKLMEQYAAYYHQLDPLLIKYHSLSSLELVYRGEEIHGPSDNYKKSDQYIKSEYYNDFYKKTQFEYTLGLNLSSANSIMGAVALLRRFPAKRFSERDKYRARMICKYLAEATRKYRIIEELNKQSDILGVLAKEELHYIGTIAINEACEPVYIDAGARRILNISSKESENNNFDVALSFFIEEVKSNLVKKANLSSWKHAIECSNKFKMRLNYRGESIDIHMRPLYTPEGSRYLLLGLGEAPLTGTVKLEMAILPLTDRHREVAGLVLQGLSNTQIAEKLFISRYTVENHLKSIYDKLNISSRTQLLSKLYFSAPADQ